MKSTGPLYITPLWHWHHNIVTTLSLNCYKTVTKLLQNCYKTVTKLSKTVTKLSLSQNCLCHKTVTKLRRARRVRRESKFKYLLPYVKNCHKPVTKLSKKNFQKNCQRNCQKILSLNSEKSEVSEESKGSKARCDNLVHQITIKFCIWCICICITHSSIKFGNIWYLKSHF